IFFTSDHGAHAAERSELTRLFQSNAGLRGGKTTLYEGGIRVPLIVRWPGRVPAGAVSRHVSSFADMLPTLAELAWVPLPSIPRSRAGVAPAQGTEAGGVSRGGIPGGG